MSAMANVTPIIATVKNASVKEKTLKETNAVPKASILDFCEKHYEDILPIILDRARHDKRKEVQMRLDFGESPKKVRRERENSLNSRAGNSPIRFHHERSRTRGRERHDERNVFNRLSHRKKSVHERLSDTYSPSITKSGPNRASSRDPSHSRGRSLNRDRHRIRDHLRGIEESYDDTYSFHGTGSKCRDRSCDKNHSPGGKRRKPADKKDLSVPWTYEDVDPFTPRIRNFKSLRKTRMPKNVKTYDGTGDPKDHLKIFQAAAQVERWAMPTWCHMFNSTLIGAARVWFDELPPESIDGYKGLKAAFLAYFMQQKKYAKDPVEIHNIKQRDGETIKEFMKLNNPELTKRLNELISKTVEEMMTATTAFIRGETAIASKKKVHTPWKSQDQSKRHTSERRSDFENQLKDGRGSNKFTPLTITAKEIFAAESGKFKPPPPMVTPVKKRSSNKFCEFHNDKGHSTDEWDAKHYTKAWMNFMIVRSPSSYNGIIGRNGIKEIQAVPSTAHGMLKFSVNGGIVTIRSTILTPTECATIAATPKDSAKRLKHVTKILKLPYTLTFRTKRLLMEERIVTPFQKSTERSNPFAATPLSVFWMPTKAIIKYIWQNKMRKRRLSTPVTRDIRGRLGHQESHGNKAVMGYKRNVIPEGIKLCPDKTEAVLQLPSPRTIKEVQILNGKLASLNRFLSKLAKKSLPHFKTLKKCIKKSDFHWTAKAKQAFKQLKQHLVKLPMLGHSPDTGLFREPSAASSRAKLYPNGKASPGASLRSQNGEHNITYRPRTSVKGQILVDFLVEKPDDAPPEASVIKTPQEPWTLFTDESSCVDGLGAGLILTSLEGMGFTYALRFQFTASNNDAEYEALIAGLRIATQMGVRNVHAKSLINGFANFSISQVPRSKNKKADALSKIASTSFAHLSKKVLVEVLKEKSIQKREMATVVEEEGPTWMTSIIEYLRDETFPDNRKEARKLRIKAKQYESLEGILYRRSFLKPWLRCIGPLQADYVIREIHEGSCSMHAGPRSMVAKAMRYRYYWPTMHRDAREMIRKCKDCQIHRPMPRHPQQPLTPITAPRPFYKWGIDIAGPLSEGLGKVKFLIVTMDYFTKWIETKAVATISDSQVKKFIWDNIVCHFGLLGEIVSDNDKQFSERANRSVGEGIKARLGEGNKNWQEELPHVLWAHRTVIKSSNDDTSFSLTYETEAVIPAEIRMPTYRTMVVDAVRNDEELWLNLDLLEERRERAAIREAKAKLKMTKYYNARVGGVTFRPGDFVYRSNDTSHTVDGWKLSSKWEGPYEVTKALGDGAYKLRSTDGTILSRTWNIAILKKCYL
nr:reverse transcriptase domain-containing protein [Tanacetum cinerariifolium]